MLFTSSKCDAKVQINDEIDVLFTMKVNGIGTISHSNLFALKMMIRFSVLSKVPAKTNNSIMLRRFHVAAVVALRYILLILKLSAKLLAHRIIISNRRCLWG